MYTNFIQQCRRENKKAIVVFYFFSCFGGYFRNRVKKCWVRETKTNMPTTKKVVGAIKESVQVHILSLLQYSIISRSMLFILDKFLEQFVGEEKPANLAVRIDLNNPKFSKCKIAHQLQDGKEIK